MGTLNPVQKLGGLLVPTEPHSATALLRISVVSMCCIYRTLWLWYSGIRYIQQVCQELLACKCDHIVVCKLFMKPVKIIQYL